MRFRILVGLAICAVVASCRPLETSSPMDVSGPTVLHQVEFRVDNGSIEDPLAYVAISLDEKQVFFGGLYVARQHNYFRFSTVSEEMPSRVTITTTIDHAPPEGRTSRREIPVNKYTPLNFDVSVHGTNIFVNQVEKFGLTS